MASDWAALFDASPEVATALQFAWLRDWWRIYGFVTRSKFDFYQSGMKTIQSGPLRSPGPVAHLLLMRERLSDAASLGFHVSVLVQVQGSRASGTESGRNAIPFPPADDFASRLKAKQVGAVPNSRPLNGKPPGKIALWICCRCGSDASSHTLAAFVK